MAPEIRLAIAVLAVLALAAVWPSPPQSRAPSDAICGIRG